MFPEWTISACFSSLIDNTCLLNYFFFLILRHLIFKHSLNLEINASKKQQQNWYTTPLFILWQIELSKAWPLAGIQCLFVCIGRPVKILHCLQRLGIHISVMLCNRQSTGPVWDSQALRGSGVKGQCSVPWRTVEVNCWNLVISTDGVHIVYGCIWI